MPTPNANENREEFLDRCMADDEANTDFPDNRQRYAFCNSVWSDKSKKECENCNNDKCTCNEKIKKAKMNKDYNYRNLSTTMSIKDVDVKSRTVAGYFSAFDNVDSDGDLIKKGAFAKSINDRGPASNSNRKIAHLAHHDIRRPIGVIQVLKEDNHGLYFESKLGEHTDGDDALKMYEAGIIKEHSIGFQYIDDKTTWVETESKNDIQATSEGEIFLEKSNGYFEISEVKLWEGSYVTFGANSSTPSYGVIKSIEDQKNYLNEINSRMKLIRKELSNGSYTDSCFKLLAQELAYIQEQYTTLLNAEPVISTQKTEAVNEDKLREFLLFTLPNKC